MQDPAKAWQPWDPARPDDPQAGVINHFFASGTADARIAPPGARFHYSDTGFMLLALLIEKAGGEPLHTAFRRRLFDPVGIADIWLAYREEPRLPETEQYFGELPVLASGVSLSFDWGGGGLVATAEALAAFLRALLGGAYFKEAATLAAMQDWQVPAGLALPRSGVGLGLFRTERDGLTLVGHSGAPGAKMFTDPASGLILTGTANQAIGGGDWHWPLAALARKEFA
jgi:CubicO group peptidase (beta-lactamase class C family)